MVDVIDETDKLLAELGLLDPTTPAASTPAAAPPPPPAAAAAPPPPPPPPPPPAPAAAKPSKSLDIAGAQKDLDEVFDSVFSFANKASNRKKTPPPVAPKPNRKIHVSSYTMNIRGKGPASGSSKAPQSSGGGIKARVAMLESQKPAANEPPPRVDTSSKPAAPVAAAPAPKPADDKPLAAPAMAKPPTPLVAFGPGLEAVDVNETARFEISCPHDTDTDDLEVIAKGPTGSKPVAIESLGTGTFSCSYVPTASGEHVVTIKVDGKELPGSPFHVDVRYAQFTDKATASGPGLEGGTTDAPCKFTIQLKEDAGFTRVALQLAGPSKAEPIEMTESGPNMIDVTYNPSAPGDYTIKVLWGEAHVKGSPFTVPITGAVINDHTRVKVTGDFRKGNVGETCKLFVEGESGAGPGPLGVRMIGPTKPIITADDSKDEGVEVSFVCRDPGEYQLVVKWGDQEIPDSPFNIVIEGEGREIKPELCTANGDGLSQGQVGETAKFMVTVPDEAGPGTLGVSIQGPHPPKPIQIMNNLDGTMEATYVPHAPGDYTIEVSWGGQPISGSPFKATVTGVASSNPKDVTADGDPLEKVMKCNQLGTINVNVGENAGAGPLRAKLEGPGKADLTLSSNTSTSFLVSFIPKEYGTYKLYLTWGDGEGDEAQISGSPFSIRVDQN